MNPTKLKPLILGSLLFLICATIAIFGLLQSSISILTHNSVTPDIIYLALILPFIGFFLAIFRILIGLNIPNILVPITIITASFLLGPLISLLILAICVLFAYLAKYLISEFHLHVGVKNSLIITLASIGLLLSLSWLQTLSAFHQINLNLIIIYGVLTISVINEKFLTFKISKNSLIGDIKSLFKTIIFSLITFLILGGKFIWGSAFFQIDWLQKIIMTYPESIFLALLLTFLIGQYTGLRLSEVFRFRKLIFKNN